jgi:hypothetical protein
MEGLSVLCAGLFSYQLLAGSWSTFLLLFLAPDLSMLGYLFGPRVGAATYNTLHTYAAPALLAGAMAAGVVPHNWGLCLIWVSHIGFDRTLGYGLKYSSAFRNTHLGRLGPAEAVVTG